MPKVVLFDVNETLLDTHALQPELTGLLGKSVSLREWFLEVLQHTLVMNEVKEYRPFGEIAEAVLQMTANSQGRQLQPDEIEAVRKKLASLPPYADVRAALQRLKDHGLRLGTLTNSSADSQEQQLKKAGLTDYFERMLSVDSVRRFKPAPETYQYAAHTLAVQPQDVLLVAAHGWDVFGAMKAGCQAALVKRPEKAVFPLGPHPQFMADKLVVLADQITSNR
ncbi:MAG: haloacid dehalogenase type II [Acidobacteriaceae bacterium]|nr:haloacid dehalogenase type II [Acidobacteriaceae bacterium]